MSVELSTDAPPKSSDLCPFQSTPNMLCLVSMMTAAVFISCYCLRSGFKRKKSTSPSSLFSTKRINCGNVDASQHSDPGTVAYIGKGRDRMSVELCQTCIESNKMLQQLSSVIGTKDEVFEPCDLCK